MSDTFENKNATTETDSSNIQYGEAKIGSSTKSIKTYQYSYRVQTVPTSRTGGSIKILIAPREIPKAKTINSTK